MTKQEFETKYLVMKRVISNQLVLNVSEIAQIKVDFSTPSIDLSNVGGMQASYSPDVISDEIIKQAMDSVYTHYNVEI